MLANRALRNIILGGRALYNVHDAARCMMHNIQQYMVLRIVQFIILRWMTVHFVQLIIQNISHYTLKKMHNIPIHDAA